MQNKGFLPFELIDTIIFQIWNIQIQKFLARSCSFFQSKHNFHENPKLLNYKPTANFEVSNKKAIEDDSLCRKDVEIMMGKIGLYCNPEEENLQEKLGLVELSKLFEEKEASLEEVQEAFYVFDDNKDGFIDAEELQRVLWCVLGLKEGTELDNCRKMIKAFDKNGDGRIDFDEFVIFMENSLC